MSPQGSPALLCPSCRERVGAGCRPEARDLSGERQQSRPARATAGRDGGGPERRMMSRSLREGDGWGGWGWEHRRAQSRTTEM